MIQKIFTPATPANPDFCETCFFEIFWRRNNDPWQCVRCSPPSGNERIELYRPGKGKTTFEDGKRVDEPMPASRPITSSKIQGGRLVRDVTTLNAMYPVCKSCYSQQYVETIYADGETEMKCLCCKANVDGVPMLDHSPAWTRGGLTKRQFDGV